MSARLVALALALSLGTAQAHERKAPIEGCPRTPCSWECWTVRVHYVTEAGSARTAVAGGLSGLESEARCHADRVAVEGFWLSEEVAPPTSPPTYQLVKVAPGALRKLVPAQILERADQ